MTRSQHVICFVCSRKSYCTHFSCIAHRGTLINYEGKLPRHPPPDYPLGLRTKPASSQGQLL